ncbi:MAG: hypothetical protein M3019_08065 [Candidatus Dormibacteraeota bacterium]|nr:hypothetical protein [Candidatus Dormibacteraeota bacterium]
MKRSLAGGITITCVLMCMPLAVVAASPSPTAAPRSIAVSVPSQATPLHPGETGQIAFRVLDPTPNPVTVTIISMGLNLGDNGRVTFTGGADPLWSTRAFFPSGPLVVPAMGYIDASVTVHMPAVIAPDLYYLGFVVRPVATGSGVKIINEIGGFFTIDVPGPRARSLAADLQVAGFNVGPIHLPDLVVGDQVAGQLTVHNTGHSAVQFWGENEVTTWMASTPTQQRIGQSLLPIARWRSFGVGGQPAFPIDLVTLSVTVTYPATTTSGTTQILLTKRMLVISPWVIIAVGALIALLILWRLRVRARRRAVARAASRAGASRARQAA